MHPAIALALISLVLQPLPFVLVKVPTSKHVDDFLRVLGFCTCDLMSESMSYGFRGCIPACICMHAQTRGSMRVQYVQHSAATISYQLTTCLRDFSRRPASFVPVNTSVFFLMTWFTLHTQGF
jgi:hypothetical protein